jgi:hypothetical protein
MVNKVDTLSTQNALLWGVAWLIISTLGGWYYGLMPVSAVGYDVVAHLPLVWHLMLNLVVWLVAASLLYVVILLYNRKAKFVDSYGRLLFAHWPATLLLLPVGKQQTAIAIDKLWPSAVCPLACYAAVVACCGGWQG